MLSLKIEPANNNRSVVNVKYYNTVIVKIENDVITLNSGGFRTNSTKKRMNEVLEPIGYRVIQKNNVWYIKHDSTDAMLLTFHDGITLNTA